MKLSNAQVLDYLKKLETLNRRVTSNAGQQRLEDAIFNRGKKRILFISGRKGGKSTGITKTALKICALPQKSVYIIGPSRVQQKEILWKSNVIQNMAPPEWMGKAAESDLRFSFPWGSFIKIDGSENHPAGRGLTPHAIIFD